MSMRNIIFLTLSIFTFSLSFSQIKVRENVQTQPFDYSKVEPYDSLVDFIPQKRNVEYLKYVGQELYLAPLPKEYRAGGIKLLYPEKKIYTFQQMDSYHIKTYTYQPTESKYLKKEGVEVKYDDLPNDQKFEISQQKIETDRYKPIIDFFIELKTVNTSTVKKQKGNVLFGGGGKLERVNSSNVEFNYDHKVWTDKSVYDKKYKIIDITDQKNQDLRTVSPSQNYLRLWLETEAKDTVFCDVRVFDYTQGSIYPFYLSGYLEKQKELYINNRLIVLKDDIQKYGQTPKSYIDINTGEQLTLQFGDIWACEDIVLIYEKEMNRVEVNRFYAYYILTNGLNTIKVPLGDLNKEEIVTLQKLYDSYLLWIAEIEQERQEVKKQIAEFHKDCQKYFSGSICEKLINNQIEIGMTKQMILYNYGEPYKSFIGQTKAGKVEILYYGGAIFYLKNNAIIAIESYN